MDTSVACPDWPSCVGQTPCPAGQNVSILQAVPVSKLCFLSCQTKHTLTAAQVRLTYLQILGELKMYSGKIFNATMMVRDVYLCDCFWRSVLLATLLISWDIMVDVGKGLCWRNSA